MSKELKRGGMRVPSTLVTIILVLFFGSASAGLNEWSPAGPHGGYAIDVAFHTTQSGTMFTTSGGRVYQSTNHGQSWSRMNPNVYHGNASMIAMDPDDPGEFYVSTSDSVERMPAQNVVTQTPPRLVPQSVSDAPAVFAASDGNTLFASIDGRLFRSTDKAQSWVERTVTVNGATAAMHLIAADPSNANVLYARAGKNIIRSSDGGATWQVHAVTPASVFTSSIAIDFRNPNRIWLGSWDSGLLFSDNAGATWDTRLSTAYQVTHVQLHPVSADTVFVGTMTGDLLRSIDAGTNWTVLPVNTDYLVKITINPRVPTEMAITGQGGVHVSKDAGATWTRAIIGLEATVITDFVRQPGTNRLYFWAAYDAGLHVISNESPSIERVSELGFTLLPPSRVYDRRVAATSSTVFLQLDARSVARTSSNGALWQAGGPIDPSPNARINVLEGSKTQAGTVFAGDVGAVYVSSDSGQSWTKRTSGIPSNMNVVHLESSPSGALYLAGTTQEGMSSSPQLLRSLDNGATWQPLFTPPAFVAGIVIDPADARILYLGVSDGLLKSTDEGASWNRIAQEVGSFSVSDVAFDPTDANVMYLTGSAGLARSVDRGATWMRIATQIYSPVSSTRVTVDPRQASRVLVATSGTGLQELTFAPDLSVAPIVSGTTVAAGTRMPLLFDVRNAGPWDATGVRLRVEIAAPGSALSLRVNGTECTSDGRIATCTLGLIRNGATIRADADATSGGNGLQVTASVEGTQPDWRTPNNTGTLNLSAPLSSPGSGGGGGTFAPVGLLLLFALAAARVRLRPRRI